MVDARLVFAVCSWLTCLCSCTCFSLCTCFEWLDSTLTITVFCVGDNFPDELQALLNDIPELSEV